MFTKSFTSIFAGHQTRALLHPWRIFTSTFSELSHIHEYSLFLRFFAARFAMEYHAVPPEERARDEKGNLLPWGYIYKE